MVRNWIAIMTLEIRTAWGIPHAMFTELEGMYTKSEELLQKAMSNERTPVIIEQCRESFNELAAKMRFFKAHYFLVPPLNNADLMHLGFTLHDPHPIPSGVPTAEVTVKTFLVGRHELGINIIYVSGNPDDKANKGFRVWYKVVPAGEEPVKSPKELTESFFTGRKKDMVMFDYEDSGKTAFIAVQVENGGRKGPWGPLVSALIP
jgi:hypothetical protein